MPDRTAAQKRELAKYYRSIAPLLDKPRADLAAAKKKKDDYVAMLPTTLVTVAVEPRVMRVLPRGNWMRDDGEIVTPSVPHFPAACWIPATKRLSRLDLAHWLVARDNPLTARVFVNRLWKQFYGAGITKSLDDSGSRAEWPTHPELLDWLAAEFVDSGWDVKHMVKLMVMAETYRQSSVVTRKLEERDPLQPPAGAAIGHPARSGDGAGQRRWPSAACWWTKWAARASSRISPRATGTN
jgi:hypothetical protein